VTVASPVIGAAATIGLGAALIGDGGGALRTSSSVTVPTDGDTVDNSVGVAFSSPQPDGEIVSHVHVAVTGP
jgi:hypothetical protein